VQVDQYPEENNIKDALSDHVSVGISMVFGRLRTSRCIIRMEIGVSSPSRQRITHAWAVMKLHDLLVYLFYNLRLRKF
jgi:hypothetical protein